jgi:hypothetical protein
MVELPGSLERATLGDILGALYRDKVSGTLCLEELGRFYQRHLIHLRDGLIHQVDTARRASVTALSRAELWLAGNGDALERLERLEGLFQLSQARISFRVMGPRRTPSERPLEPSDFLYGRRRRRDVLGDVTPLPAHYESPRQAALRSLGLAGDPSPDAVRAAFRKLARHCHPDLYARADETTRAESSKRFIELSRAYEALIA